VRPHESARTECARLRGQVVRVGVRGGHQKQPLDILVPVIRQAKPMRAKKAGRFSAIGLVASVRPSLALHGFHDTANAMATSIATNALRPKTAVMLSGILNLVGASSRWKWP
jgi:hypothetical protein